MNARRHRTPIVALVIVTGIGLMVGMAACGGNKQPQAQKQLSERERDSLLARQPLPGAGVVGKALDVADSAAARAARELPSGQ